MFARQTRWIIIAQTGQNQQFASSAKWLCEFLCLVLEWPRTESLNGFSQKTKQKIVYKVKRRTSEGGKEEDTTEMPTTHKFTFIIIMKIIKLVIPNVSIRRDLWLGYFPCLAFLSHISVLYFIIALFHYVLSLIIPKTERRLADRLTFRVDMVHTRIVRSAVLHTQ